MQTITIPGALRAAILAALGAVASACGLICPADVPMAVVSNDYGPHADRPTCEAARVASTCAPITRPDAACTAYCKANWWSCLGSARNASSIVGAVCYPKTDNQFYFTCVETATCHCV